MNECPDDIPNLLKYVCVSNLTLDYVSLCIIVDNKNNRTTRTNDDYNDNPVSSTILIFVFDCREERNKG